MSGHTDFNNPSGATLGLYSAILQIGAFSAIFFCERDGQFDLRASY